MMKLNGLKFEVTVNATIKADGVDYSDTCDRVSRKSHTIFRGTGLEISAGVGVNSSIDTVEGDITEMIKELCKAASHEVKEEIHEKVESIYPSTNAGSDAGDIIPEEKDDKSVIVDEEDEDDW